MLFIDSAGDSTVAKNADLMVKRDRFPSLAPGEAAMALYTLQAFAPAGGSGNRTSMRGGGPLVTLVHPLVDANGRSSLWRLVFANVRIGLPLTACEAGRALPWLRPTRTSEKGQILTPADSHPLEGVLRHAPTAEAGVSGRSCDRCRAETLRDQLRGVGTSLDAVLPEVGTGSGMAACASQTRAPQLAPSWGKGTATRTEIEEKWYGTLRKCARRIFEERATAGLADLDVSEIEKRIVARRNLFGVLRKKVREDLELPGARGEGERGMTDKGDVAGAVVEWYRSSLGWDSGAARAARARLRRCQSTVEALAVAETHDLNRRLKEIRPGAAPKADQLALIAIAFARLRSIDGDELAAVFGKRQTKDGPRLLSELRFQSLIRVGSHRDLMAPLRRSLAVLGPDASCNGRTLARDLYWWSDRVRNRWCFQFFGGWIADDRREETTR